MNHITDRELWLNALNHRYSGRFPSEVSIRPEPQRDLVEHFGVDDFEQVKDILGITRRHGLSVQWSNPEWETRKDLQVLKGESPYAGERFILHDERTFEDEWGVVRRVGSTGKYMGWVRGPLSDMEEPDASVVRTPPLEYLCYRSDLVEHVQQLKEDGCFTTIDMGMPFREAWFLRGMENFLMDYYLHPEFVAEIYCRLVEWELPRLKVAIEAGVDMVGIGGDFAMQDRVMMGSDKWREFDKVALRKAVDFCRSLNPDLKFHVHSDGNLSSVMDDLVCDLGFDVINPLQPECMDLDWVKEEYGDQIVMHGCGSLQRSLPFGTPEEVRSDVRTIIDRYGEDGGLVIAPANYIGFDIAVENIVAFFETARDYFPY